MRRQVSNGQDGPFQVLQACTQQRLSKLPNTKAASQDDPHTDMSTGVAIADSQHAGMHVVSTAHKCSDIIIVHQRL